ncbi:Aliphatic amidase AmiE [hydrothermal vent metagenome]|uniref:Aliphatic amidase AmiE n=1 Tax=hydrothermal vent metagenome TaxID=652676 RepID=A0A1W1CJ53_9ZZZZ
MHKKYLLCTLSFETTSDYNANLHTLLSSIKSVKENSIIVAPEVVLTGFDYENFEAVTAFAPSAIEAIKKASINKTVILTIIEKRDGSVYNFAKVFHNGVVIYERAKAKLFKFGGEEKYFVEGNTKDIDFVVVEGIKIAILICFELRFKELWSKCEGADVIAVPAWWGKIRSEHFKILTQSLALMNQCYVIASDSKNDECTKISAIIAPDSTAYYNGNTPCLKVEYKKKDISLMRRYMDVGIE